MDERESQLFEEACHKRDAGRDADALQDLRALIRSVTDPADRAGLLYHEVLWLIDLEDASMAKERVEELKRLVATIAASSPDSSQIEASISLKVMSLFADAKVLLAENQEAKALPVLDALVSNYPKQLALPNFREILAEAQVDRGFILADQEKWGEARAALESVAPLEEQKSLTAYYLGHCYYMLKDYRTARDRLTEALRLGLSQKWEGRAHYMLGLTNYHFNRMEEAKDEFDLCVKTAEPEYLGTTKIWEWLEATSRALGLEREAEKYRQCRTASSPNSKAN